MAASDSKGRLDRHDSRRLLMCDCCNREIMGEVRDDKVIFTARRHGRKHVLTVPLHGNDGRALCVEG